MSSGLGVFVLEEDLAGRPAAGRAQRTGSTAGYRTELTSDVVISNMSNMAGVVMPAESFRCVLTHT